MILCVLATVLFSVGWFYFFYYFNPIKLTPSEPITAFPPVSIIISARNSVLKLENNIQHWLTQDYPNFEVVIIDDRSSDETAFFLVKTAEKEPLLKYVLLDPDVIKNGSKKLALTLGIKKAKNNYFLLTDADCIPNSDQWLKHMATGFTNKKDIVLGVSPVNTKKSFLGRLTQYENLLTAMQYLGMSIKGKPYMGVGRNLSYRKALFEQNGGFGPHLNVLAGDDDLFVNRVANPGNVAVCLDPESFTISIPKENWSDWVSQKRRHFSVSALYKQSDQFRLLILNASRSLGWILLPILFLLPGGLFPASFLLVLRFVLRIKPLKRVSLALREEIWVLALPILDFVHSIAVFAIAIQARFSERKTWM